MKVGLLGFGKAGRPAAAVMLRAEDISLQWVLRRSTVLQHRSAPEFLGVDSTDSGLIHSIEEFDIATLLDRSPVDAIVDFSSEEGLDYYADEAARRGITVVSAISNYPESQMQRLHRMAELTPVMHSPNITLGVNFLIIAAKILRTIAPATDVGIVEEHYKGKADVSGTAKVIARALRIPESEIKSIRAGGIVGVHEVLFGFPYQTVRLKHESISREAFGDAVLFALENLKGRPAGFYTMEDLLIPYFNLQESEAAILESQRTPWWQFWRH